MIERKRRLSQEKQRKLQEHFAAGTPARTSADLVGVNKNTGAYYYHRLREIILAELLSLNAVETVFRMMRYMPTEVLEPMLSDLADIVPMSAEAAFMTARLKRQTKAYGLSYGDCACLALAKLRSVPVLTEDKIWEKLDIGVEVRLIWYAMTSVRRG